jgi:hypothetical protein
MSLYPLIKVHCEDGIQQFGKPQQNLVDNKCNITDICFLADVFVEIKSLSELFFEACVANTSKRSE